MTNRERILSLVVGSLFLVVGVQWAFNQYRSALSFRQNRLNSLNSEAEAMQMRWLAGAEAERQLGEYKIRSLSSDSQVAQSSFQSWLLETAGEIGLIDAIVDPVSDIPVGELYHRYGFRVSGKTDLSGLVDLVYAMEARDQLHRIRELNFAPVRKLTRRGVAAEADSEGLLGVVVVVDAISLTIAEESPPTPSDEPSWRIARSKEEYRKNILNRNFFEPPNQAPRYGGSEQLTATIGRSDDIQFEFKDPEDDSIRVAIEGELPDWASWDEAAERLKVSPPMPAEGESTESFKLKVIAMDDGYPSRETTQLVVVKTQLPPPPPKPEPPKPGFDDSTQTFLTALVQGRDDWRAWMSVRTRGKTLKLKVGDEFEIGSISGKVTKVTAKSVMLEIDGKPYELRPTETLSSVLEES